MGYAKLLDMVGNLRTVTSSINNDLAVPIKGGQWVPYTV